jgi:hypothetical protein
LSKRAIRQADVCRTQLDQAILAAKVDIMPQSRQSIIALASKFDLSGVLEVSEFSGKGNINSQTYLIAAVSKSKRKEYLLQKLNPRVFVLPRRVMEGMIACIEAQQKAISDGRLKLDQEWETVQLVPTKEGKPFLELGDERAPQCWRLMKRIPNVYSFRHLGSISDPRLRHQVAGEAGRGLAIFLTLTSRMDASHFTQSIPGYRDTELYYSQLDSVLAGCRKLQEASEYLPSDPWVRQHCQHHYIVQLEPEELRRRLSDRELNRYIELAMEQKSFALTLAEKLKTGDLKKRLVHGDTKLENFLFSNATAKVRALVDLDTIMAHTWLTDWGDLARSLVNIAGERETDLERIETDPGMFQAAARGFIDASGQIPQAEISLMAAAAQIMALELGVRFLADYLRGDTYFRLKAGDPPNLNKTRALVQFRVFEDLRKNSVSLCIS